MILPLVLLFPGARPAQAEMADVVEQSNLVEIGLFGGVLLPSEQHELLDENYQHRPFKSVAPDLGLRLSYLPLPYLGLEVEGALMPTNTTSDLTATLYGVRFHLLAQYPARVAPFIVLGAGAMGIYSKSDVMGKDADFGPHWGVGLKFYASRWLALRADLRQNIQSKLGPEGVVGHWEVLAGLSLVLNYKEKEEPSDRDGDGIIDEDDECPDEKGDPPTGCPPKDTDGDGITDDKDQCPSEKGEPPTGCPPKDTDGDGIIDKDDQCPSEKGDPPTGCPPPKDTDGDGIIDEKDRCPNEPETKNGFEDADGCPDEVPVEVKRFTGAIKGITFEVNKDVIRPQSFGTLNKAAQVLKDYSDLRLMIRGHTDSTGKRDHNMDLSQRRADSVKQYLVAQGIAEDRMRTEGLGPDEPVADNKTARGRAENRRIEFKIIIGE